MTRLEQALDAALVVGATARLTRLVTTDDLGEWWIRDPAFQVANWHMIRTGELPWWDKYRSGLSCPHCVSFHAAWIVLASHAMFGRTRLWRFGAGALTLSFIVGHLSAHIDGGSQPDDPSQDDA